MRYFLFIIGFTLATFGIIFFLTHPLIHNAVSTSSVSSQDTTNTKENSSIIISELTLEHIQSKSPWKWIIQTKNNNIMNNQNQISCTHITCTILKNKMPIAIITAKDSIIDREKNKLCIPGKAEICFHGLTINTANIRYMFSRQHINTNAYTIYRHPQFLITAAKNTIDLKTATVKLEEGVKTEFHLRSSNTCGN